MYIQPYCTKCDISFGDSFNAIALSSIFNNRTWDRREVVGSKWWDLSECVLEHLRGANIFRKRVDECRLLDKSLWVHICLKKSMSSTKS